MKNVYVISLGCPKNLADTEEILGGLLANGYALALKEDGADTVLINTCAFLASARAEADAEIKRAEKLKKQDKILTLAVAGCLVEKEGAKLLKKYPGVDAFIGMADIPNSARIIDNKKSHFPPKPATLNAAAYKLPLTLPHSAYLKISDGCNNRCAYCLIPSIRGAQRSKPVKDVLKEARALVKNGAKEISLIAQDTTAYGTDLYGGPRLSELLKELVKIKGLSWIRIMYAYPEKVTEELLSFINENKKMCKYLDMPLQHISQPVLKAMARRSTEAQIREKMELIRRVSPGIALRTNFITGFPGETEKDFAKLKMFIEQESFNNVAVFPYSKEAGTPAAEMKNQVPQKIKLLRARILEEAQSRVVDDLNKDIINKTIEVIIDAAVPGGYMGRGHADAPDVDGGVYVKTARKLKPGAIVNVRVTKAHGYLKEAQY